MLLAGDEFGRTQLGNNNAYCQDNEISWVDWSMAETEAGATMLRFTRRLAEIRRDHPVLRSRVWLHGDATLAPGLPDIAWFDEQGRDIPQRDWNDGNGRRLTLRRAAAAGPGVVAILVLMLNADQEPCEFCLPPPDAPTTLLLNSAEPDAEPARREGRSITVAGHSLVVLSAEFEVEEITLAS
jgi:isoamylase